MTDPAISPSDTDTTPASAGGDTPKPDPATPDKPSSDVDWKAEAEKYKAHSRKHEERAKKNAEAAERLAKLEEEGKTEAQRQSEALTNAQTELKKTKAENLRLNVALDQAPEGMPLSKVKKLAQRLTGDTQEELEADAKELFADFTPADTGGDKDDTRRLPTERLKPGGVPSAEPEETDPAKLAAKVPRPY
jgi:hypothetical protein